MFTYEKTQLRSKTFESNSSRKNQTFSFVDNRKNPVQRYVSVTSDNKDTGDFVTFNSIAFGLSVAGAPVENFKDSNFSTLAQNENIAFVAHGSPGSSGSYNGDQIADKLLDPIEGMNPSTVPHNIIFTSCYAGTKLGVTGDDSVVGTVKRKISPRFPGSTVRGAMGPSVKTMSAATDSSPSVEEWGVVDPKNGYVAGIVQSVLEGHYGIVKLPSFALTATTTEDKAREIQNRLRPFFEQFIHIINGNYSSVDTAILDKVNAVLPKDIRMAFPNGLKIDHPMKEL